MSTRLTHYQLLAKYDVKFFAPTLSVYIRSNPQMSIQEMDKAELILQLIKRVDIP